MKQVNDFKLTKTVTVGALKNWMNLKDNDSKTEIITLISHRFKERYINHITTIDSGFLKMAIACLMIETLESFKQGVRDTAGKSKQMFIDFFKSETQNFPGYKDLSTEFYKSIRCGILHQAETTNAWRILLTGNLLDQNNRSINAKLFLKGLENSLENYLNDLKIRDWQDKIWENALLKLDDIYENCKTGKIKI